MMIVFIELGEKFKGSKVQLNTFNSLNLFTVNKSSNHQNARA